MPEVRLAEGMTLVVNDSARIANVLLCGGNEENNDTAFMSDCWLYNVLGNNWTKFTSLPQQIGYFAMITLHGSSVYVFGGFNVHRVILRTVRECRT